MYHIRNTHYNITHFINILNNTISLIEILIKKCSKVHVAFRYPCIALINDYIMAENNYERNNLSCEINLTVYITHIKQH